jgi:hypothetical protein
MMIIMMKNINIMIMMRMMIIINKKVKNIIMEIMLVNKNIIK